MMKEIQENINRICYELNDLGNKFQLKRDSVQGYEKKELLMMDLIQRIYANMVGLRELIKLYNEGSNYFMFPIILILRGVLSDSILGVYLTVHSNFNEEVDVLDVDYVNYLAKTHEKDIIFANKINNRKVSYSPNISVQESYDELFSYFEKFLDSKVGEKWVVKSRKNFRSNMNGESLKSEYMCDYIEMQGEFKTDKILYDLSNMYQIYRYLSQYEHYTHAGRNHTVVSLQYGKISTYIFNAVIAVEHSLEIIKSNIVLLDYEDKNNLKN